MSKGAYCLGASGEVIPFEVDVGKSVTSLMSSMIAKKDVKNKSILPIKEKWGDFWYLKHTSTEHKELVGWKSTSKHFKDSRPPEGVKGVLNIHPVSRTAPAVVKGKFKINQKNVKLSITASGNNNGNYDLAVNVNGKEIGRYPVEHGFDIYEFYLDDFYNQVVDIEILIHASGWYYEYAFIDNIEFKKSSSKK
jgi:hypothetical protein